MHIATLPERSIPPPEAPTRLRYKKGVNKLYSRQRVYPRSTPCLAVPLRDVCSHCAARVGRCQEVRCVCRPRCQTSFRDATIRTSYFIPRRPFRMPLASAATPEYHLHKRGGETQKVFMRHCATNTALGAKTALVHQQRFPDSFKGNKAWPGWNVHLAEMAALPLQIAGRISLNFTAATALCAQLHCLSFLSEQWRGSGTVSSPWWYVGHYHSLRIDRAPRRGNRMDLSMRRTSKLAACSAASAQPLLSTLQAIGTWFGLSGLRAPVRKTYHPKYSIQDSGNCLDLLHRCLIQSAVPRLGIIRVQRVRGLPYSACIRSRGTKAPASV